MIGDLFYAYRACRVSGNIASSDIKHAFPVDYPALAGHNPATLGFEASLTASVANSDLLPNG